MSFQVKTKMLKEINIAQKVSELVYFLVGVKLNGNKAHKLSNV